MHLVCRWVCGCIAKSACTLAADSGAVAGIALAVARHARYDLTALNVAFKMVSRAISCSIWLTQRVPQGLNREKSAVGCFLRIPSMKRPGEVEFRIWQPELQGSPQRWSWAELSGTRRCQP